MVAKRERDGETWFECEDCGLMFDDRTDAKAHESACSGEEPGYLQ